MYIMWFTTPQGIYSIVYTAEHLIIILFDTTAAFRMYWSVHLIGRTTVFY